MIGEIIKSLVGKAFDFTSDKLRGEKSQTPLPAKALPPIDPFKWIKIGADVGQLIRKQGRFPEQKVFFDSPTGPAPILPLAYWLIGARQVVTADTVHDFDVDYLIQNLTLICQNKEDAESIFGEQLNKPRFYELIEFMDHPFHMQKFLEMTLIDYWAPVDPGDIALPNSSIDFYISSVVSERYPKRQARLKTEAQRLLKPQGLFIDWQHRTSTLKP